MISKEFTLNLVKVGVVLLINLLILSFAFRSSGKEAEEAPAVSTVSQPGSSGDEVTKIQTRLKQWGYFTGPITGNYGPQTTEAVKSFQRTHGINADGIANAKTLELIGLPTGSSSGADSGSSSGGSGAVSETDVALLARIISAEARGEPYTGQVAVGAVVLNRVESSSFPDSIAGVVYQPGAFTAITDGQINEAVTDSAKRAAREALNGSDPSGGALYYFNPDKTSNKWMRTRPVITRIGKHLFCS